MWKKTLGALGAILIAGCPATPAGNGVDCGAGDSVEYDGATYCVYASALIVENGFECPEGLELGELSGHIGACAPPETPEGTLREMFDAHKMENPEQWPEGSCVTLDDCVDVAGANLCAEGLCLSVIPPQRECASGEMKVATQGECLQDDAVCYQIDDGSWCTGPASAQTTCESGDMPVATQGDCLQDDAACYQLSDGSWCTGPRAAMCPMDAQARPTPCEPDDMTCFAISESLSCDRLVCPEGSMSVEGACPVDAECLELVNGVLCTQ